MMLRRTLFLLSVCGIAAFLVLAARLYQIQIVQHDEYEAAAIAQQVRETTVSAARGTIYDRNGVVLAMSAGVDTVYISPAEIERYDEDKEAIARGLSEILGVDYETILKKAGNTNSWYEVVARKVEEDVAEQVRQFKSDGGYGGIKIEADTKRYYPNGSLAAHGIGFVGLLVPHMTRRLLSPDHSRLLPGAACFGATFLLLADLLSRVLLRPLELPVGAVTSLVGAGAFVYIFYTTRRKNQGC